MLISLLACSSICEQQCNPKRNVRNEWNDRNCVDIQQEKNAHLMDAIWFERIKNVREAKEINSKSTAQYTLVIIYFFRPLNLHVRRIRCVKNIFYQLLPHVHTLTSWLFAVHWAKQQINKKKKYEEKQYIKLFILPIHIFQSFFVSRYYCSFCSKTMNSNRSQAE